MAEVVFDRKLLDDGESPGVPEIVRHKTQYLAQSARRVTIEAKDSSGKFAKCNGFKLTQIKDNDEYPQEEIEDICEAIMRCVNAKYEEALAVDADLSGMDFRAIFDRRPNGKRERPAIDLPGYSPNGPDLPMGHGMTGNHTSEIIGATIENLGSLVDKLMLRIDGLILHIVTMSDQHKDMYEPLVKIMAIANQNSVLGMEMQRRAMEYMYSTKRLEEEQLGSDRRAEKWMEFLKKPAQSAIRQFGKYMTAKQGKDNDDDDDDDDSSDDKKPTDKPADKPADKPSAGATSSDAEPDRETIENPVAMFSQALGQLLQPKQWAEAAQILTKKQMKLFSGLVEAKEDSEVVALYTKMENGGIPMLRLVQLAAVLDKDQADGLEKLKVMVERHREGWSEDGEGSQE